MDRADAQAAAECADALRPDLEHVARLEQWRAITEALQDVVDALERALEDPRFPAEAHTEVGAYLTVTRALRGKRLATDDVDLTTDDADAAQGLLAVRRKNVLADWSKGHNDAALLAEFNPPPSITDESAPVGDLRSLTAERRVSLGSWLASRKTVILGLVTVTLAVVVGLVQFVSDEGFNNQSRAVSGPLGVAFAARLAGVTLAQLANRIYTPPPV